MVVYVSLGQASYRYGSNALYKLLIVNINMSGGYCPCMIWQGNFYIAIIQE